MKKLKFLIVFIIIILSCVKTKEEGILIANSEKIYSNQTNTIDLLKKIDYLQTISNNIGIKNKIHLTSEKNDTISILDIKKIEKTLFFYYSYSNCTPCIDDEIQRIKEFDSISNLNIVIVSNYEKIRDMHVFKKINKIAFPIYNLVENKIDIPITNINIPFYFMLNKEYETKFVYTPNKKEDTKFVELYFETINSQ